MKAIIFGINGQDGFYLKQHCESVGISCIGVSRSEGAWLRGSVSDFDFVGRHIKNEKPDFVFHLAANSTTRHDALFENHEAISTGSLNILEAVYRFCPHARVFITGSGVQFQNKGLPISENDPFEATSPYAIARIQSVYAARYYRRLGIRTYVGYLFHHESPLRKNAHMSRRVIVALAEILTGKRDKLEIGDPTVQKEWGFAGDIAEGILKLVMQDTVAEAAIGTGKAYSILDWIKICFQLVGLDWQGYVIPQKSNFTSEYPVLVSNPAVMKSIGWEAKMGIEELAELMVTGFPITVNKK